ncbi:MAG: dihydrofolate reductase [Verrucomicrobiales bacterium]|nr:dihydrofolate reductase [Verrucomicrobiales bacterium]
MISAMAQNWVIGTGKGGIPWHLPRDTRRFREFTDEKFLLLGRRTFEEMTGWFTNQTPIVLTRDPDYKTDHGFVVNKVEEAISTAAEKGAGELAVCGGASVYDAALPYTDELFLTLIDGAIEGGAHFPDYDKDIEWKEISREAFPADEENEYGMTFLQLRRLHPSSLRPSRLHLL